jgi:hypothetical protein
MWEIRGYEDEKDHDYWSVGNEKTEEMAKAVLYDLVKAINRGA